MKVALVGATGMVGQVMQPSVLVREVEVDRPQREHERDELVLINTFGWGWCRGLRSAWGRGSDAGWASVVREGLGLGWAWEPVALGSR